MFSVLEQNINAIFASAKKPLSVMLTGGRSAEKLYQFLAGSTDFLSYSRGASFYFGDERCVPPDDPESNFGMVMKSLFASGVPEGTKVMRMEAEKEPYPEAAAAYAALLPPQIDILLLSVGEDGHIASLFPHHDALKETTQLVIPVIGPKKPYHRLSITPPVIYAAKHVFVMAIGEEKERVFQRAKANPMAVEELPASMVANRVWITG